MQNLPITHVLPKIKARLRDHATLVVQAPPGAGKTTALPLALLDEPWLEGQQIILLEPRRLAVRASAARMAAMLGERVGERIGYQIKMDSVQSPRTRILIVTEGILTRKLQHDPALEGVGLILFDEFHERSLHADLSLALAREAQTFLREDLKILVMSATLNAEAVGTLLDAPIIRSEGRAYPVIRHYFDPATPQPSSEELPACIHRHIRKALEEKEGNILVFLPGIREIQAVEALLKNTQKETQKQAPYDHLIIAPLYGDLSQQAQDRAIAPPPHGRRKVVLATNIAQTSLTIEGIRIVIDSGLENRSVFNPFTGMDRLEQGFISEDAATQRAGRAGRQSPGEAYHLWHRSRLLTPHDTPEILRADLTQLVLELAHWGTEDIQSLTWLDLPSPSAITHAQTLLRQLGALDERGSITPHGRAMSRFGLHPRLAHMILKAREFDLSYEASLLAVLLNEKDIFPPDYRRADLRERVEVLHDVAGRHPVSMPGVDQKHCRYLLADARRIEPQHSPTLKTEMLGVLLAYAYPERIAHQRAGRHQTWQLANGKDARLHADDPLSREPFLVVADLHIRATRTTIRKAIPITRQELESHLSDLITEKETLDWNPDEQRIEARIVRRLGRILLSEQPTTIHHKSEATDLLLEELEALGLNALNWSPKARRLQERIIFLHHHGIDLPDCSDTHLLSTLDEWLAPYLDGLYSLRALQSLDLHPILLGCLSYEQSQTLDRLAPDRITVPSGSRIPIDYSRPEQPILAVRLQEMFGTAQTPTVLDGQLPLMLHLLSPAHRPMQVTQDLASFWQNTYDEVKKELRGKYKKHYWPDGPLEAKATSRVKKRM
jgi:ATP-dependent helicase HrpB